MILGLAMFPLILLMLPTADAQSTRYLYLENRRLGNSNYSCYAGNQAHIQAAFYTNFDPDVCRHNCEEIHPSKDKLCQLVGDEFFRVCRQRLSVEDLNILYHDMCGIGNPQCLFRPTDFVDFPLSLRSWTDVVYICIPEWEVFDPCRSPAAAGTQRSVMLTSETMKGGQECHRECNITFKELPRGAELIYNFISQDTEDSKENELRYKFVTDDSRTRELPTEEEGEWRELRSGYMSKEDLPPLAVGMAVQFKISSMSRMSRLWLSLGGVTFDMKCRDPTHPQQTTILIEKLTTETSTPSILLTTIIRGSEDGTNSDSNNTDALIAAVVLSICLAGIVCAVVVAMIRRRREQTQSSLHRPDTAKSRYTVVSGNPSLSPPPSSDDNIYSECHPEEGPYAISSHDPKQEIEPLTGDHNYVGPNLYAISSRNPEQEPKPLNTGQGLDEPRFVDSNPLEASFQGVWFDETRSDDQNGGYSHISPRIVESEREASLNYHHIAPLESRDVYSSLQREPKRREVLDNVYSSCSR